MKVRVCGTDIETNEFEANYTDPKNVIYDVCDKEDARLGRTDYNIYFEFWLDGEGWVTATRYNNKINK